ncbi:hypothetical protein BD770DRAFT_407283 [Pilaira anomala]|nr:hypothetical protein BD770DRAFT_407283 [Pilaira anomala]
MSLLKHSLRALVSWQSSHSIVINFWAWENEINDERSRLVNLSLYWHLLFCKASAPVMSITANFLKSHDAFPVDIKLLQSNVILMITEYIYSSIRSRMNIFYYPDTVVDNLKMP